MSEIGLSLLVPPSAGSLCVLCQTFTISPPDAAQQDVPRCGVSLALQGVRAEQGVGFAWSRAALSSSLVLSCSGQANAAKRGLESQRLAERAPLGGRGPWDCWQ